MSRRATLAVVAICLSGCSAAALPPIPEDIDRIVFDPQPPPFCGTCETTSFVATANGGVWIEKGHWAGSYENWRVRRHFVQRTPEQFDQLRSRLEPYRPDADTLPNEDCAHLLADDEGAIVTWLSAGKSVRRVFDFSCLDDPDMNEAIRSAPRIILNDP